jgi:Tol biopolymer transport system component
MARVNMPIAPPRPDVDPGIPGPPSGLQPGHPLRATLLRPEVITTITMFLMWMTASVMALVRMGPYPPNTAAPFLFAGSILFAGLGAGLMWKNERKVAVKTMVALAASAAILPMVLGRWMPGIAQPKTYPMPGGLTVTLFAGKGDNKDLWMVHGTKAGSYTKLTDTPSVDERAPNLSRDGTQIVYSSDASGGYDIWLMTLDAGGRPLVSRRLTSGPSNDFDPSWSPDGSKIVFSRQDGTTATLESYEVATGVETSLGPASEVDFNPTWSPNGKQIAYTQQGSDGSSEIWIMNADGTHPHVAIRGSDSASNPHWSPDGKLILFTAKPDIGEQDVYIAHVNGTGIRDITLGSLTREEAYGWTITGLPLFLSNRSGTGGAFLYVCELDGSNVRLVATI